MKIEIEKSPFDRQFRNAVLDLLNNAQKEIIIVTGEWSAYDYLELRDGVKRALERGIKFKVYGTSIPAYRIVIASKSGCELYEGEEEVWQHFVIADGKNGIVSEKHPPEKMGDRCGSYFKNSPAELKNKISLFKKLIKTAKIAKAPVYRDPLLEIIETPLDFGVYTDSSKADEVIYA